MVAKWLRQGSAKPLYVGSTPTHASFLCEQLYLMLKYDHENGTIITQTRKDPHAVS